MALQWAGDKREQLHQFSYVFHIALKHVKAEQTIPELIVKQHKLKSLGVTTEEIQDIIEGKTEQKVSKDINNLLIEALSAILS